MCIKAIDDHSQQAKKALGESSGNMDMSLRLDSIVDEMTCRGLERCRLQKSLC
jgi:hypothetical protein